MLNWVSRIIGRSLAVNDFGWQHVDWSAKLQDKEPPATEHSDIAALPIPSLCSQPVQYGGLPAVAL